MGRSMNAMKSIQIYINKDAIANFFIVLTRIAINESKALGFFIGYLNNSMSCTTKLMRRARYVPE